jgi:hypothetical protein
MTCKGKTAWLVAMMFSTQVYPADIVIQNNDGPGEGFNDPTDATTIPGQQGNNPGATLGELRLNLFEEAARIWGEILNSDITITVAASFDPLACSNTGAVLGSAAATSSHAGFSGSEPGVAYTVALAESLNRSQLNGLSAEITAVFNSTVDADEACLGDGGFYYGLDGNVAPGSIPMLPVILHELGHGLGFSSLTDAGPEGSGAFVGAGGFPDSFSRNLYDLDVGKSWDEMNNAERKASALNEPSLVWNGAKAATDRYIHLAPQPMLKINAPENISGEFEVAVGEDPLAVIPPEGVTAGVLDGNTFDDLDSDPAPADGCSQINFSGTFTDHIVMFDQTDACGSLIQAYWSLVETAMGVIILAAADGGFPDMSGMFNEPLITIPYVGVEHSVGPALRAHLESANVTIGYSATRFEGDNQGKVKMYAPEEFREGASVSHWSRAATPDLLMEPSLGLLDYADVDLTAAAFRDIGWSVNIPGQPPVLIFKNGLEN